MRARDVMSSPVITATPEVPVKEAAALLAAHGFTALPVVDEDGRLIGIVTEADLVRDRFGTDARYAGTRFEARAHAPQTVGEVMSRQVVGMGPGTDIALLARSMVDSGLRCVPIVDGGHAIGVVTRRDLVRVLARSDEEIARDVRNRLTAYGGSQRWAVAVHDGEVTITDRYDDTVDQHVATVLAESVPGVAHATTRSER
jgi:CBS-domain-containing membrane protein